MTTFPPWHDQLAELRYLAAKVARVHGLTHPDTAILSEVVATFADCPRDDHLAHAALAGRIRVLTRDFQPWSEACGSVRQLYLGLAHVVNAVPGTARLAADPGM